MPYKDKEKQRDYQQKWWLRNSERLSPIRNKHSRVDRVERRLWLRNCIEEIECGDCGLSFAGQYWMADFHHENGIGQKIPMSNVPLYSWKRMCEELNKGVFLCPNCHRIRHKAGP